LFGEGDDGPTAREATELLHAEVEPSFIARNIFRNGANREQQAAG
jgi:hypothetical protein